MKRLTASRCRRFDGVGRTASSPANSPIDCDVHHRAALLLQLVGASLRASRCEARLRRKENDPRADDDLVAVDGRADAATGGGREVRGSAKPQASGLRVRDNRAGQRVLAGVCSTEAAMRSKSSVDNDFTGTISVTRGRPFGQRAGLIDHDRIDLLQRFQHFGVLDENALLRSSANADHDRHRRGEAQGARTGDDQHGHGDPQTRAGAALRGPAKSRSGDTAAATTATTGHDATTSAIR